MYYQQGDVIIETIETMPTGESRMQGGRAVLAEGEATGHAHVVTEVEPGTVDLIERDGVLYLRTTAPTEVRHDEHAPVSLPAGSYRVRQVREYDHLAEEARAVLD